MKSRESMPGCSVNNTLMIGTASIDAMVALSEVVDDLLVMFGEVGDRLD